MKKWLLSFSVVLTVAGCGSSASNKTPPLGTLADISCDQLLQCDRGQTSIERALVGTNGNCDALLETVLLSDFNQQAYLDNGSVVVDRGALSDCKSAIAADPCVATRDIPACRQIYVGTLAEGEGCSRDAQCMSGACTAANSDSCGVCLASAAVGEACDPIADNCATLPDAFVRCEPGAAGGTCVIDTTSYLTVGLGANCDGSGGVERTCASPYYCNADRLCAERGAVGAACDPDLDDCAFGTTCANTGLGDVCLEVVVVGAALEPCGELASGALGVCDASKRLYCDRGSDLCAALAGTGAENSDCFAASDCNRGLVCVIGDFVEQPGRCETTGKAVGTPCDSSAECESLYCHRDPLTMNDLCAEPLVCP